MGRVVLVKWQLSRITVNAELESHFRLTLEVSFIDEFRFILLLKLL